MNSFNLKRKIISKYLFISVLLLIIIYIFINMYQISSLKRKGYEILPSTEIQCIKSICINRFGVNECIVLNTPVLVKKNNIRSLDFYSRNVYEVRFDLLSDKCE